MIPADFDYRVQVPPPPLCAAVERIWYAKGVSPHGRERILPSPAAVLLVVLGPPLRMTPPPDGSPILDVSGVWLSGPHERPIVNEPSGMTHVLGATFVPGGIAGFLEGPASGLANRIVPIDHASTRLSDTGEILDRLRTQNHPSNAMDEVAAWLMPAFESAAPDEAWTDAILALAKGEAETVAEVQESLGVSRRYFVEQVRRRAGLTPKSLQRIARMRRLLCEIDARKPIRWSLEAVGAGYFDQAHAIRDFRAFTGMTPTEYVERRRAAWGVEVEPGEATNFVPESIR